MARRATILMILKKVWKLLLKYLKIFFKTYSGLIFLGLFTVGARGKRPPFPNIGHTYLTMMKHGTVRLYLEEDPKIYKSCDTALNFR